MWFEVFKKFQDFESVFPIAIKVIYGSPKPIEARLLKFIKDNLAGSSKRSYQAVAVELHQLYCQIRTFDISPGSIDEIRAGFVFEFSNNHGILEHYEKFVRKEIIEKYNQSPYDDTSMPTDDYLYYALYFAVVQSSGYGKSRMLLEAGLKHLNTVYCCVRESSSTGYPKANTTLAAFLESNKSDDDLQLFLCCCYFVASGYVKHAAWEQGNLPLSDFWLRDRDKPFEAFWDMVIKAFNDIRKAGIRNYVEMFQRNQERYERLKKTAEPVGGLLKGKVLSELVIVIDEARTLLKGESEEISIFRRLRRALRDIKSKNMVIIFTDTLSSVSNFTPASTFDASYRPTYKFLLLPPFYEILTYDELKPPEFTTDFNSFQHYMDIFGQGRPIWKTLFGREGQSATENLPQLIAFARKKLANQPDPIKLTEEAKIATLSVRCGITGVMDHSLASNLMSSYMGTGTLHFQVFCFYFT